MSPAIFEFVMTERATEKDRYQVGRSDPSTFLENLEMKFGHKVGPKDGSGIIGARFAPGAHLEKKNVLSVTAAILDFDGKTRRNGEEIKERLDVDRILSQLPFRGLAHSSYSSSVDFPKFRVLMPLARPITVGDHDRLWLWLSSLVEGKCDQSCKDASRMFYLPRTSPEAVAAGWAWFKRMDGPWLDVSMIPADFKFTPASAKRPRATQPHHGVHISAEDARPILAQFWKLKLVRWMVDQAPAVSREAWRGLCTNLAAASGEDSESQRVALEMFDQISQCDPDRYSRAACEKTFNDARQSVATHGPMTYAALIDAGAPASACPKPQIAKAPVVMAQILFQQIQRGSRRG